jgi:hypothetical protein
MLFSFEFPYLCVPLDMRSDLNDLVFLRGVVASVASVEPTLCSSNPRGSHFAIFTPLGTSKRKLCDRFSFCLPNPCLSFHTWANFHEVSPERELSLRQRVVSGGAIACGCRWSHGSTSLGLSTFSCSFGFHGFLTKCRRENRTESFQKSDQKRKFIGTLGGGSPPPSPKKRLGPASGRVGPRSNCMVKERRFRPC